MSGENTNNNGVAKEIEKVADLIESKLDPNKKQPPSSPTTTSAQNHQTTTSNNNHGTASQQQQQQPDHHKNDGHLKGTTCICV